MTEAQAATLINIVGLTNFLLGMANFLLGILVGATVLVRR